MKIFENSIQEVEIKFNSPVNVRGKFFNKHKLLKLNINGKDLYLSTLHDLDSSFHQYNLSVIKRSILDFFNEVNLNLDSIDLSKPFFNTLHEHALINSLDRYLEAEILFHIETVLLFYLSNCIKTISISNEIKINDLASFKSEVGDFEKSTCLKYKISPQTKNADKNFLQNLVNQNSDCLVRLDGNRQWELEEFNSFLNDLPKNLVIDYIEEPFVQFSDLYLFCKRSTTKIALDESFQSFYPSLPLQIDCPIVIKPSLFGLSSIYSWMLNHPNQRVIISSSYEHPSAMIGLKLCAQLRPSEFHGLKDVYSIF